MRCSLQEVADLDLVSPCRTCRVCPEYSTLEKERLHHGHLGWIRGPSFHITFLELHKRQAQIATRERWVLVRVLAAQNPALGAVSGNIPKPGKMVTDQIRTKCNKLVQRVMAGARIVAIHQPRKAYVTIAFSGKVETGISAGLVKSVNMGEIET